MAEELPVGKGVIPIGKHARSLLLLGRILRRANPLRHQHEGVINL
jgi:hypothetical protein